MPIPRPWRAFAKAALLALVLTQAIPGQADTRVGVGDAASGQVITNTAYWRADIGEGSTNGDVSATIVVQEAPAPPTLRVYEAAQGRPTSSSFHFRRTDYLKGGRFHRSAMPADASGLADRTGPVNLSGPLDVIRTQRIRYGAPLFYVLTAEALNRSPSSVETAILTVTDRLTGDSETLRLYETAPDSGQFGGWTDTRRTSPTHGDGRLATGGHSTIDGVWTDAAPSSTRLATQVLVGPMDPHGLVYDSSTGAPVNGARVTLINMRTGKPAEVFGEDLRSSYPATIITGGTVSDGAGRDYDLKPGEYRFPFVLPGTYRIIVSAPEGYVAPSTRSDDQINAEAPEGMDVTLGSRGEPFTIRAGRPVALGVPVDRMGEGSVDRDGSISLAQAGDFVTYTVTIEPPPVAAITISDTLLPEIRMVPGTLRLDGKAVTPREVRDGFVIEEVPVNGRDVVMTYLAQVSVGAAEGASLPTTTTVTEALTGSARMSDDHLIDIEAPFGTDETVILGQVIAGPCGAPTDGRDLSGLRILLESGDMAVTDSQGRFHFQGIAPRPHVVQLDQTTLPRHATPILCRRDTRNAGSPISSFVDLRPGMMARVEFHVDFDEAAETAESATEAALAEIPEPADPAQIYDRDWLARQGLDPEPALLTPAEGWTPGSDAIDAVILKPAGAVTELRLNGEPVPEMQLDQPILDPISGASLERWHALRLRESRNVLDVVMKDADGHEILREQRILYYETIPFRAELVTAGSVLESDGRTTPVLQLRVLGRSGGPVRPGTRVQFSVAEPHGFENPVERDSQPGSARGPQPSATAVVAEDGLVRLRLAPVRETGTAHVTVMTPDRAPGQEIVVDVPISAAERPWVLVGLAEGTLAERTIRSHLRRSGDIGNDLAGRVSLFAEGVVAGKWLLTLRLDTARDGTGPFSAIDPERDYVVYGDASYQDDAAPSRFPLYLRLRSEEAETLVGDFAAEIDTRLVDLSRQVTGLRVTRETPTYRVMAFAARTTQRYVEDRIALDGTSGPYELSRTDIVPRSETVTLLEVDGDDISRVVSEETLVPGQDYVLSATTGRLFLRRPVPAFTPDMNRFVLKVGYETDEEIQSGVLAGIRAERQLSDRVRVGATLVHAGNADGGMVDVTLLGADIAVMLSDSLAVGAEVLQALRNGPEGEMRGKADELHAEFDDGTSSARLYLRSEDGDVSLASSMDERRIDSLGAEGEVRLLDRGSEENPDDGLWLSGEAHAERNRLEDDRTASGDLEILRRTGGNESALGLSFHNTETGDAASGTLHATARLAWSPDEGRVAYGLELREPLSEKGDADAESEMLLSAAIDLSDRFALTATWDGASPLDTDGSDSGVVSVGAVWAWGEDGEVRAGLASAYGDGTSGQALFLGLDRSWKMRPGLELSFGLDSQNDLGASEIPLGLGSDNPWIESSFTATRTGLRYTADTWSLGIEVEGRTAPEGDRANLRLSGDGELGDGWTYGAEIQHGVSDENGKDRRDTEAKISFAHRLGGYAPITLFELEAEGSLDDGVDTRRLQATALHSRYLSERGELVLRASLKGLATEADGARATDALTLLGAEYRHQLNETWSLGGHGSLMRSARTGNTRSSYGVSVGMTPFENGYLELGYNVEGFEDEAFSEHGTTNKGFFLEYRMKFDQESFRRAFR
ncbi:carboxypeptidase regulatory-like domain-containing protein [Rubellimicrobium rubrum]|uniref:Carboxypeptidase regulatory-like domain-containing protein n=1 Tax=Rubellimicrobium rubrum TaxID=2585369 RepID=A0A5C4N5Y1_9RHOB|nr:carboxypeptidase-like regulatory domain-containing protein [Rubellimicrobium rubrum]TNC52364.1 carboxypeptidase regulatory-like domain-containing protein [Rubellimicrobium rubrum]